MVELVEEMRPADKRKLSGWFRRMLGKIGDPPYGDARARVQELKARVAEMEKEAES